MARYIDADKFIERLKASPAFLNMGMDGYFLLDAVENLLKNFPTADVAPKSEVAREIFEAIDAALEKAIDWTNEDIAEAITKEDSIAIASKNGALLMIHTIKTCLKTMGREYVGGERYGTIY